jgi:SAM-dependent methyltransferase
MGIGHERHVPGDDREAGGPFGLAEGGLVEILGPRLELGVDDSHEGCPIPLSSSQSCIARPPTPPHSASTRALAWFLGKMRSMDGSSRPDDLRARRPEDFFDAYDSTPPWDIGRPQAVFAALARSGGLIGRVLDSGCGTGEHALLAAQLGLESTGIDAAPKAIALARAKAVARRLTVRFLIGNVLELPALGESFDTVLDCGMFHVLDDPDRARYVHGLAFVIPPEGSYHLLCFSDRVPGAAGPRRVRREEIAASFDDGWRIDSIERARLETAYESDGVPAWFASITRL